MMKIMEEKEAIRAKVVTKKYGLSEVEWLPKLPNRGHVSNVWKDIHSVKYASDLVRTFWKASRLRLIPEGIPDFGIKFGRVKHL